MTELDLPPLFKNLEERVFDYVSDKSHFTVKEVQVAFPNDNERMVYRAINRLENERRVRFLQWHNRAKLFTAVGTSRLPAIMGADGRAVIISDLMRSIEQLINEDGHWTPLDALEDLLPNICSLLVIAHFDDPKALKDSYWAINKKLIDQRAQLTTMVGYIDSIIKHPVMKGDVDYFKEIFTSNDPALPDMKEVNKFKVWLNKYRSARNA